MTYDYFKVKLNNEKSTLIIFQNSAGCVYGGYNPCTWK